MSPPAVALLILFLLKIYSVSAFDPAKVDYCKKSCNGVEHTACNCEVQAPREIQKDNIGAFRQEIVDVHNYWRNEVASGEAEKTNPAVKSASDMRIMNYDLELEYIAICLAGKFNEDHDRCKITAKGDDAGQNLAGTSERNDNITKMVTGWYDEIKAIESEENLDILTSLGTSKGVIGHFTQMVWANSDLVGCARVWNPQAPHLAWSYTLICNYGSTSGPGSQLSGLPVYKKGDQCVSCPPHSKCETQKYPALCGKLLTPPDSPVATGGSISDKLFTNLVVLVVSLFIFILL